MKKIAFCLLICLFASSCTKNITPAQADKSIVILYDNDVHCNIDGYPTIGNHAFDFGMARLNKLMFKNTASVVCANFTYANSSETVFFPYILKTVGSIKIAFVGCSTPAVMNGARGVMYDEQGRQLYDMHSKDMAQMVQQSVDNARNQGADYELIVDEQGEVEVIRCKETNLGDLVADAFADLTSSQIG